MRYGFNHWLRSVSPGSSVAMSCGLGCRCGSDPSLLWLWRRLKATAPTGLLAWEPPYATGAALKKQKKIILLFWLSLIEIGVIVERKNFVLIDTIIYLCWHQILVLLIVSEFLPINQTRFWIILLSLFKLTFPIFLLTWNHWKLKLPFFWSHAR